MMDTSYQRSHASARHAGKAQSTAKPMTRGFEEEMMILRRCAKDTAFLYCSEPPEIVKNKSANKPDNPSLFENSEGDLTYAQDETICSQKPSTCGKARTFTEIMKGDGNDKP